VYEAASTTGTAPGIVVVVVAATLVVVVVDVDVDVVESATVIVVVSSAVAGAVAAAADPAVPTAASSVPAVSTRSADVSAPAVAVAAVPAAPAEGGLGPDWSSSPEHAGARIRSAAAEARSRRRAIPGHGTNKIGPIRVGRGERWSGAETPSPIDAARE
jgi:hypothetical protein